MHRAMRRAVTLLLVAVATGRAQQLSVGQLVADTRAREVAREKSVRRFAGPVDARVSAAELRVIAESAISGGVSAPRLRR